MSDEFTQTRQWAVRFNFKPTGCGMESPGPVAVIGALDEQGWSPSVEGPGDDGWYVITCHGVEAERGDLAEGLVFQVASSAAPSPPRVDDFDRTVLPELNGQPCGGTWFGSADMDDFTVGNG